MAGLSIAAPFDRGKLANIADGLVVGIAVALPWSTSAVGILLVLWLLAVIPTLDWEDLRRELLTPAGGLPVLLFLLGVAGMAWADVSWLARWNGLDGFFKLLVIPLLMVQFRRSENGMRVFTGFLVACGALLIASWTTAIWPDLPRAQNPGVPVKSYIVQSAEFAICAAGLLYLAVDAARVRHWALAVVLFIAALAFLHDIFFIVTSRTTLVIIPVLVLIYGMRFGGKGIAAALAVVLAVAAVVWASSPYVRHRASEILTATDRPANSRKVTSSEERFVFWAKSVRFIESAPLIGHGTGSITAMFRRAAIGHTGVRAEVSTNPHNQTLAVAIQLGLLGAAVLWAMWIGHLLVFRADGFIAWIGLVVVAQNIVGSLFNSFLFDYTEGWLYVVGFGVAAGMILRQRNGGTEAQKT